MMSSEPGLESGTTGEHTDDLKKIVDVVLAFELVFRSELNWMEILMRAAAREEHFGG